MINPSSTSASPSCYCLAPTFLFFYFIFRSSVFHTPDMENFTVNYHLEIYIRFFLFPWSAQCWSCWHSRYALLGAASFLGGSMRMTVSLCVIMVEITNNLKLLPLIMLVLLISKVCFKEFSMLLVDFPWTTLSVHLLQAVGDAFNEGLYEEQARLRGIPLLESRPKYQMRKMTAKEACGNKKVSFHLNAFMLSFYIWLTQTNIDANIIYPTRM